MTTKYFTGTRAAFEDILAQFSDEPREEADMLTFKVTFEEPATGAVDAPLGDESGEEAFEEEKVEPAKSTK